MKIGKKNVVKQIMRTFIEPFCKLELIKQHSINIDSVISRTMKVHRGLENQILCTARSIPKRGKNNKRKINAIDKFLLK